MLQSSDATVLSKRFQGLSDACVGVFTSVESAHNAIEEICALGVSREDILLFTPSADTDSLDQIPTSESEQAGMAPALAGSICGALGLGLGAALFLPGGPITVLGALATGLVGAGGAAVGATVAAKLEQTSFEGLLPVDELYVYKDALAKGRTVLRVATSKELEPLVRSALECAGAESIDAAREEWWVGVRDAHQVKYTVPEQRQLWDDPLCRAGYEAGLRHATRPWTRSREDRIRASFDAASGAQDQAFAVGYRAGEEDALRSFTQRRESGPNSPPPSPETAQPEAPDRAPPEAPQRTPNVPPSLPTPSSPPRMPTPAEPPKPKS